MAEKYIAGFLDTKAGKIPTVSSTLTFDDRLGALKVRLGIGRMHYRVTPGLYACGRPDAGSPVFVSANYKLSFDILRRSLNGLNAWLLVLDTKGVNVWCAAGKGTFSTEELVNKIKSSQLESIVSRRKLILPQLGATGVAAHEVKRLSGFSVIYGPVRAEDIRAFVESGMKARPEMRRVTFTLADRAVLIPMEFVEGLKYLLPAIIVFLIIKSAASGRFGLRPAANLALAYTAGTVINPLLLPLLPGRSFSLKGFFAGAAIFIIFVLPGYAEYSIANTLSWAFIMPAVASFLAVNFTGASTYTSLSGVKKEMKYALPLQIAAAAIGTALWLAGLFIL